MKFKIYKKIFFYLLFVFIVTFLLFKARLNFWGLIVFSYISIILLYLINYKGYGNYKKYYYETLFITIYVFIVFVISFIFNNNIFILIYDIIFVIHTLILLKIHNKWKKFREDLIFKESIPLLSEVIEKRVKKENEFLTLAQKNNELEKEKIIMNRIFYNLKALNATLELEKVSEIARKDLAEIIKIHNYILEIRENDEYKIQDVYNVGEALLNIYEKNKTKMVSEEIFNYVRMDVDWFKDFKIEGIYIFPLIIKNEIVGRIVYLDTKKLTENIIKYIILVAHQIAMGFRKSLLYRQVLLLSRKDGLTNLFLPRIFNERLNEEFKRSKRYKSKLSLIMMDLDHFKYVNDKYGHLTGDRVLQEIARVILKNIKEPLLAARYGGEEFVIICPSLSMNDAFEIAENIRREIESLRIVDIIHNKSIKVTISGGIAELNSSMKSPDDLIREADDALYQAKEEGRNRNIIYKK